MWICVAAIAHIYIPSQACYTSKYVSLNFLSCESTSSNFLLHRGESHRQALYNTLPFDKSIRTSSAHVAHIIGKIVLRPTRLHSMMLYKVRAAKMDIVLGR